ncbi:patatin-like phospholipase family protein [Stylonychia lemnae]|uniref:Patatin-like phospholipase family protein n=1 Tax=Stylonychia lemnae TaxID=5949 RepID=A0A078B1R1_STYLE|nr:patatin-like phospholipase family protein [Stylonychia lemnae]|eukprot:CDW88500.1 patatin-like phospholipase family protein [Stylonychia lemnae]
MQLSIDPIFEKIDNPTLNSIRLDKQYSILSLDGGGVKGLMTCRVLEQIEQEFRRKEQFGKNFKIIDAFDCVIGTSVGGLIAIALVAGYSAKKLSHAMSRMMPIIFKDELDATDLIDLINKKTFNLPLQFKQVIEPAYNEKDLEDQFIKYLFSEDPDEFIYGDPKSASILRFGNGENSTLGDLKQRNSRVRLLLTAVNQHRDLLNGPMFSPRIFDTENEDDLNKTIISVARATSAAPTFFKPSNVSDKIPETLVNKTPLQEELDVKENFSETNPVERQFIDGGLFANNPAAWGLALASTKIKIENIRMLSIGTSYPRLKTPQENNDDASSSFPMKQLTTARDKVLELIQIKEDGKMDGSLEYYNMLALDLQKTSEQLLELFKPIMLGRYFRFNPPALDEKEIGIDTVQKMAEMNTVVHKYFENNNVKERVQKVIECFSKEDQYHEKVVDQLKSALTLLSYAKHLNQKPSDEILLEQAALVQLLHQQFESVMVTQSQVQEQIHNIKSQLSLYTDGHNKPHQEKKEQDGPSNHNSDNIHSQEEHKQDHRNSHQHSKKSKDQHHHQNY